MAGQLAELAEVDDLLDEALALFVARMRLAGEDELDWAAACPATSFTMLSNCWKINGARL